MKKKKQTKSVASKRVKSVKAKINKTRSVAPKSKNANSTDDQKFNLSPVDVERIAKSLGVEKQDFGDHYRLYLENPAEGRKLTLEIYPEIPIGRRKGTLITVYTPNAHLQLHFCSGYVVSELLNEVTFVGVQNGKLSGLTIEKGAACSLYSNVDTEMLSGDLTTLGPEVMLSGIALSLTDSLINE